MNEFCDEVIHKLEEDINNLSIELENSILISEAAIELILKSLGNLKQYVLKVGFLNLDEEINFFKRLKPTILSKLIYYNTIYKVETKKPYGGEKAIRKYLNNEVSRLKKFFDNNLEFYKYFRTNSTYLDHKYFVRGKHDIKLSLDTYYFESDHTFSTSHDYKAAKIMANDLIQVYLEGQISATRINTGCQKGKSAIKISLNWTASKTSLIELIYALHTQAVFENGNADIKVIAKTFETIFGIDLGDIYHTYLELRNRKNNRTKFLDLLREGLIKKMDEQEENSN